MKKVELAELVNQKVTKLMEDNREYFNETQNIMTPLSSQLAVHATLQVLQDFGIFPKTED